MCFWGLLRLLSWEISDQFHVGPPKSAMRTACVHSGALRAPPCIQGNVIAHFAGRHEIGGKFPLEQPQVDPKSTHHTTKKVVSSPTSNRLYSISFFKTNAPGGVPSSGTAVLTDFLKNRRFRCHGDRLGTQASVQLANTTVRQ